MTPSAAAGSGSARRSHQRRAEEADAWSDQFSVTPTATRRRTVWRSAMPPYAAHHADPGWRLANYTVIAANVERSARTTGRGALRRGCAPTQQIWLCGQPQIDIISPLSASQRADLFFEETDERGTYYPGKTGAAGAAA